MLWGYIGLSSVIHLLINSIISGFNWSGLPADEGEPVLPEMADMWIKKVELPEFTGTRQALLGGLLRRKNSWKDVLVLFLVPRKPVSSRCSEDDELFTRNSQTTFTRNCIFAISIYAW